MKALRTPKHVQVISEAIADLMSGPDGILIVNIPPGHLLTTTLVNECLRYGSGAGYVASHCCLAARETARNPLLRCFSIDQFERKPAGIGRCDVLFFDDIQGRDKSNIRSKWALHAIDATSARRCVLAGYRRGAGDIFDKATVGALGLTVRENLCLPGEYDPDHRMRSIRDFRTVKGDILWPDYLDSDMLIEWKARMGASVFSCLVNQRAPESH